MSTGRPSRRLLASLAAACFATAAWAGDGRPPRRLMVAAVRAMADTYVESGTEATWDHGRSRRLDADARPRGVAYLKFDLSHVTAPIGSAWLFLSVTNASEDAARIYRVPDSSWSEGTGDGHAASSNAGNGLRWIDVDRNGDGRLDASDDSPLVPDAARAIAALGAVAAHRRIAVDVTAAFTDGPGVYTLAIASTSSDGITVRSREARAGRPVLRLYRTPSPRRRTGCTGDACDPPYTCLGQDGPLVSLPANGDERYSDRTLDPWTRIDARPAVFAASSENRYPISLGGGAHVCVAGGTVLGHDDRGASWTTSHDVNSFGIAWWNPDLTVDGLRVDNVTDGIRPYEEARNFTVRKAWLSYIRDDCIEDDHANGGLIEDSLFDGCYVGIASRPTPEILADGYDGRNAVLTIRGSLVRLQPMPGPRTGSSAARGNGVLFKWHERAPRVALHGNVFLVEEAAFDGSDMSFPDRLESCADNVLVWLGDGEYPEPLPDCIRVTRDRGVWDAAVADWHARNPQVGQR